MRRACDPIKVGSAARSSCPAYRCHSHSLAVQLSAPPMPCRCRHSMTQCVGGYAMTTLHLLLPRRALYTARILPPMNNPRDTLNNSGGGRGAQRSGAAQTVQARQAAKGGMFGRRSTAPGSGWSRKKKIVALSAIFGIIIGLGVTAAAGGTLYFTFQSQTDPFTASSAVELRNLNVVRDGDTLTVTGVLKNSGQTSISRLWIDNLAVSNLVAFQSRNDAAGSDPTATNDDLAIYVRKADNTFNQYLCLAVVTPACSNVGNVGINNTNKHIATLTTRQFDGISMAATPTDIESVLEGGRTQAFKVVITCDGLSGGCPTLDISREVAISDRLTLTFGYASGDDILVSDAYSARVRSG